MCVIMRKTFTAIIIDDELAAREVLRGMLAMMFENITVIAEADCFNSAVNLLSHSSADFIFMDISLGRETAFDVLDALPENISINPIFVTAHEEFAIKGYYYNAFDYILKPVGVRNFTRIISKRISQILDGHDSVKSLNKSRNKDYVIFPDRSSWQFVKIDDIAYLKAQGSYTNLVTSCKQEYLISKPLKYFEYIIEEYSSFIRVHKSYIVNLKEVACYDKSAKSIILRNKEALPVTLDSKEFLKFALI